MALISQQMYPSSHKTIFVLDHTPYFGISSEDLLEFDFTKARGPGFIPLAPIVKSLWTCIVEAALEYCRIVWDIFPQHNKLIRFIVSDSQAQTLNSWSALQQNTNHLLNALGVAGVPGRVGALTGGDPSIVHGLRAAVQAMCECSEAQHDKRTSLADNATKVLNRCRVICLTSARDNASINSLLEIFQNEIIQANKVAAASDHLITIHHCHLVIIAVFPDGVDPSAIAVVPQANYAVSGVLSAEVHCSRAGGGLVSSKLCHLILGHYDLASTTVTGIPMKEEQNASSSANYDVEIFHPAQAHATLLGGAEPSVARALKEGAEYETVTLKWCTPRGVTGTEIHNCTAMHRITPTDVNSRPSSCLINFLLNGRSVMLEMARRGGAKVTSHLLAAHGGEIFIHALSTGRSVLEDPPSVSEGCGGRVTDYRITDFGVFMQQNKIVPIKKKEKNSATTPNSEVKARLEKMTKYWPITISSTCIFNFKQYTEPLLSLMVKDTLSEEELVRCKQCIYSLITLEAKHEPLQPTHAHSQRSKGPKREEQYRQMWAELETYVRAHGHTDMHTRVLQCLLECRNKDDKGQGAPKLDQGLREIDQFGKETPSRPGSPTPEATRATVIRATTDSPMSPPPHNAGPIRSSHLHHGGAPYPPRNLLDIWISWHAKPKRAAFAGQLTAEPLGAGCTLARLYPQLNTADPHIHTPTPNPPAAAAAVTAMDAE